MRAKDGGAHQCRLSAVEFEVASGDKAGEGTSWWEVKESYLKTHPGICTVRGLPGLGFSSPADTHTSSSSWFLTEDSAKPDSAQHSATESVWLPQLKFSNFSNQKIHRT